MDVGSDISSVACEYALCAGAASLLGWRREASPLSVLGDHPRVEELKQVVGPSRLGASTAHLETSKGLTAHDRTGDRPIDIEITNDKALASLLNIDGRSAKDSSG